MMGSVSVTAPAAFAYELLGTEGAHDFKLAPPMDEVFSTRMTLSPSSAARTAVFVPEHPPPITTTSHVFVFCTSTSSRVLPGSADAMSTLRRCAHDSASLALPF